MVNDGILKPEGRLPAKSSWAFLMHALGIKPGDGLVEWRPSMDGYIWTQNGGMEIEIDGSAFCTIINLFMIDGKMDDHPRGKVKSSEEIKRARFRFGSVVAHRPHSAPYTCR